MVVRQFSQAFRPVFYTFLSRRSSLNYACFSTAINLPLSYEDTIKNLEIGSHTRVIIQGFVGKKATFDARQSLEYGTNIVGGVKPGETGEHLGLPVLPNMRAAMQQLNPDATAVYVAGNHAAAAIEEAVEAEIPLIVAVSDHVPLHDMIRVQSILRSQSKSRLIGPNTPGIISPVDRCRIGFPPISIFSAGSVGIVARSGTLSYETVASTTRAGIGQSLVIGVGGDVLPGTDFVDALTIFEHHEATKGIILVGEIGGESEILAAKWIRKYRERTSKPKPIMGLVAGVEAPQNKMMGHSGAICSGLSGNATRKITSLRNAGVIMTDHPAKFGDSMKRLLDGVPVESILSSNYGRLSINPGIDSQYKRPNNQSQITPRPYPGMKRFKLMHTWSAGHRPRVFQMVPSTLKRTLFLKEPTALHILRQFKIPTQAMRGSPRRLITFDLTVSRQDCKPYIRIRRYDHQGKEIAVFSSSFLLDTNSLSLGRKDLDSAFKLLKMRPDNLARAYFGSIVSGLMRLFREKEAYSVNAVAGEYSNQLAVFSAKLSFDDGAFLSANRHSDIQALRSAESEVPAEVEAAKHGIVYIKIPGDGNIGVLGNGAGLAMNTLDVLTARGGSCANFLDTGGKVKAETVKVAFAAILSDERVKTIFLNIFGGLTQCDTITKWILAAYSDLKIDVPIVVRMRGTNEEFAQQMIVDSGLPLLVYDDFEKAAAKVIELANRKIGVKRYMSPEGV